MIETTNLQVWAQNAIGEQSGVAAEALACYCSDPKSAKQLHRARKCLARLRAALQDLGALAGATPDFYERVHQLHRRAGKVRDADVLIERLEEYCAKAPREERKELDDIRAALRKRRKRARRKLQRLVRDLPELRT